MLDCRSPPRSLHRVKWSARADVLGNNAAGFAANRRRREKRRGGPLSTWAFSRRRRSVSRHSTVCNMFGTKLRTWMEAHIVRSKKKKDRKKGDKGYDSNCNSPRSHSANRSPALHQVSKFVKQLLKDVTSRPEIVCVTCIILLINPVINCNFFLN